MQAFECSGLWWLPDAENERVAGTLRVSASGDMRLSLIGGLGQARRPGENAHHVILGSVDKSPEGNDVTLTGCRLASTTFGSFADRRERYLIDRGLFGGHACQDADFAFREMSLRLGGLTDWARSLTGFAHEPFPSYKMDGKAPLLSYAYAQPVSAQVPGAKVSLGVSLSSSADMHEYVFREEAELSVTGDVAQSADELNSKYVYPLQNLMSFVCDRAQGVERFSVRQGDPPEVLNLLVIGPRVQPEEEDEEPRKPVRSFEMLFTLADFDFGEMIGKWLRLTEKYSEACGVFFGLQYGPPAYIDMIFPGIVQTLHLYHSRREGGIGGREREADRLKEIISQLSSADRDWLVDRVGVRPFTPMQEVLRELVSEHSVIMNPLVSNRQDRFVNQVMNTLQYVIHREPEVRLVASHGAEMYWAMQKLRILFKACLLRELSFSDEKAREVFGRNPLYQHICQLAAMQESHPRQA